ncbi:MAG: dUTP diphosphatase [Bacilli bacterium]|nr:dUTP diphosphatase [Bacilli bacterium]
MRQFEIIKNEELIKYKDLFSSSDVILPKRQTSQSSGYDFYLPYDVEIKKGEQVLIKTGVKVKLEEDEFLAIFIRSSMGIKKGLNLANQVGIIDSDYYGNIDNDGHIMIAIRNISDNDVLLKKHDRICQGIIMKYLVTDDDKTSSTREGGFGSTK